VTSSASDEVGAISSNAQMLLTAGTLTIDGLGRDSSLGNLVVQSGAGVQVNARNVNLAGGGSIFGTLDAEANGVLAFTGGTFDLFAGTALNGPGQFAQFANMALVDRGDGKSAREALAPGRPRPYDAQGFQGRGASPRPGPPPEALLILSNHHDPLPSPLAVRARLLLSRVQIAVVLQRDSATQPAALPPARAAL